MLSLDEVRCVYVVASLHALLQETRCEDGYDAETTYRLFREAPYIDPSLDMFWIVRNTELTRIDNSYREFTERFAAYEAYGSGGFDNSLTQDNMNHIAETIRLAIEERVDYLEEGLTWDGEEGFVVRWRASTNSWWLKRYDDRDDTFWVQELGDNL